VKGFEEISSMSSVVAGTKQKRKASEKDINGMLDQLVAKRMKMVEQSMFSGFGKDGKLDLAALSAQAGYKGGDADSTGAGILSRLDGEPTCMLKVKDFDLGDEMAKAIRKAEVLWNKCELIRIKARTDLTEAIVKGSDANGHFYKNAVSRKTMIEAYGTPTVDSAGQWVDMQEKVRKKELVRPTITFDSTPCCFMLKAEMEYISLRSSDEVTLRSSFGNFKIDVEKAKLFFRACARSASRLMGAVKTTNNKANSGKTGKASKTEAAKLAETKAQEAREELARKQARIANEEAEALKAKEELARIASEEAKALKAKHEAPSANEEAEALKVKEQARIANEEAEALKAKEEARIANEEAEALKAKEELARIANEEAEALKAKEELARANEEAEALKAKEELARIASEEVEALKAKEEARIATEEAEALKAKSELARIANEEGEALKDPLTAKELAFQQEWAEWKAQDQADELAMHAKIVKEEAEAAAAAAETEAAVAEAEAEAKSEVEG
jgi:hypothetical protein